VRGFIFVFIMFFAFILEAGKIEPVGSVKINAAVLDMVIRQDRLYVATDKSSVVIYSLDGLKELSVIKVRQIHDFVGELIDADIYSVDVLDNKILLLAQAEDGYSELFVKKGEKIEKVLDKSAQLYAKAAKFVDSDKVIMALMSDEIVLYDINAKKTIYRKSAGEYFFSAMAISPSRSEIAVGDEGGEVVVLDTATGDVIRRFVNVNKDKILSLDINEDFVAAGSRDKKVVLYDIDMQTHKEKRGDFFVYVVGISPKSGYLLFGDNERFDLKIVDSITFDTKYILVGHKNIVNKAVFIDENRLITGSESGEIKIWRLK